MKKTMAIFGVAIFLISQVCLAASVDPTKIVVPRDSGRIVETYISPNADAPVIAYVQDIHLNYEAQKAEADVMETLIRDYGFDLVLLEGKPAGSNIDFKSFRTQGSKEARVSTAEELLKEGTISAVNYLDLATDYNFVINGLEDMTLYKKETEDHMAIFENRAEVSKLVATLQNVTSNLKLHIYTKEMRDLDDKIAAYDKDELGLVEYVKFLQGLAAANNIEVKKFPNVALFIGSSNLEGQIDFPAVETEHTAAADAIEKALTEQAKKDEFTAKGLSFRTGELSQGAYYSYLKDTAVAAKVDIAAHKNLDLYTSYITTFEKIDTTALFKELKALEEKIQAALIKTPEQKKLAEISKGLEILSGFANTKLVPDEYNYYVQNKASFDLDGWLKFMKDNSAKFGLTNPVPSDISILKTNLPLLERFYGVSFDRDNAFVVNMKASISKLGKDKAIFVAGGFHTPNMKKLLKENGFSYLIVAPRVALIKNYENIYIDRTKSDIEFLNKMVPAAVKTATPGNRQALDAAERAGLDPALVARIRNMLAAAEQPGAAVNLPQGLADLLNRWRTATPQDKAALESQISNAVKAVGCMGKYSIKAGTTPQLNRNAQGQVESVTMTVVHADTGQERTVTIGARERKREDFVNAMQPAFTGVAENVRTAVTNAVTGFKGIFLELEGNSYGIFGFEHPTAIAVSTAVADMPMAFLHEAAHLALRAGTVTRDGLLNAVGGTSAVIDASGRTFAQATANFAGNEEMLDHYAIRAFTHNINRGKDIALSNRITNATLVYTAQHGIAEQLKERPRHYFLIAPREATNLDNLPMVQALRNNGATVTIARAANTSREIRDAIAAVPEGAIPLVIGFNDQIAEIAEVEPSALAGIAVLGVEEIIPAAEDGRRIRETLDLEVTAVVQIDELSRQTARHTHPSVQSLRVILSQLRETPVSIDEVLGLIPVAKEDATSVSNRLKLIAQLRLLPKAEAISPIRAQEIMASRSIALAA